MEDYKKITLESYKKNVAIFSEHFKGVFDLEKRKEFSKFTQLLPGKKILDVGCGAGDHSLWFKQNGFDVVGIDLSPEMVSLAKEKGIDVSLMDMEDISFTHNYFDGIWSVTSILHLKKDRVPFLIDKFSNLLSSKGILFIVLKKGYGEEIKVDSKNKSTKRYFAYWQKEELMDILKKHFELIEFWEDTPRDSTFLHFLLRKKN